MDSLDNLDYNMRVAVQNIRLCRYLLERADKRGLTHGEKHHVIEVALMLLHDAEQMFPGMSGQIDRHGLEELNASDIPF